MKRHALIVGGTKGAGRALAGKWIKEGREISVVSRTAPSGKLGPLAGVHYFQADLSDSKAVKKVVGNVLKRGPIHDLVFFQRFRGEGDSWAGELDATLTATKNVIDAVGTRFGEAAAIVAVGTVITRFVAEGSSLGYHVAKAGLEALVRYYAVSLAKNGVRVNGVSPSTFEKEESREFFRGDVNLAEMYRKVIPLGRIGTADELADVISFLCGPQSSYITGQNIVVDGGFSLVWQESFARRFLLKKK